MQATDQPGASSEKQYASLSTPMIRSKPRSDVRGGSPAQISLNCDRPSAMNARSNEEDFDLITRVGGSPNATIGPWHEADHTLRVFIEVEHRIGGGLEICVAMINWIGRIVEIA